MADGVTEVEKVAKTAFTLIARYNVGFNANGAENNFLEELLDSFESRMTWVKSDIYTRSYKKLLKKGQLTIFRRSVSYSVKYHLRTLFKL